MSELSPKTSTLHKDISRGLAIDVVKIRDHAFSQLPLWQSLPRLALLGNGIDGFYDVNTKLYFTAKAPVGSDAIGLHGIHLDCATGKLGDYFGNGEERDLEHIKLVEAFTLSPSKFDAQTWIDRFTEQAKDTRKTSADSSKAHKDWLTQQGVLLELIPEVFTPECRPALQSYVDTLQVFHD